MSIFNFNPIKKLNKILSKGNSMDQRRGKEGRNPTGNLFGVPRKKYAKKEKTGEGNLHYTREEDFGGNH